MSGFDAITLEHLEADPHFHLRALREYGPVTRLPAIQGWMVTGRTEAVAIMRDDATFTVDDPRFTTAQILGPSMLSTDGEEHSRHRSPFVEPYSASAAAGIATWIEDEAARLVQAIRPDGCADLREAVAAPLALHTIIRSLGLTETTVTELRSWYDDIVAAVQALGAGETDTGAGAGAFKALSHAVHGRIDAGGDGLLAGVAGGSLTDDEVAANAAVVMFGAIETAEGATSSALLHLLGHPGQLDEVRADRSLLPNAIEESFRLEPAAAVVDRYATRDIVIGGVLIEAGDYVSVSLAGANRDPAVFPKPDQYDIHRTNARQHTTFAYGPHACLGIHLARLEAEAAVRAVLDQLPGIELDAEATIGPRGLVFRKPVAVVARWDAG